MSLHRPGAKIAWLALPALLLAAGACGGGPTTPEARPDVVPDDAEQLPADPLLEEQYSGVEDPTRLLIDATGEWRSFHRRVFEPQSPDPPPPAVDFSDRVVVAAAMGQRSTGGYRIFIKRIYLSGDTLFAEVEEVSPGEECVVTQALTAPVRAVQVPAPRARTLVTMESRRVENCG